MANHAKAFSVSLALVISLSGLLAVPPKRETPEEKAVREKKVMEAMAAEGLSKDRCYLKGKRIAVSGGKFRLYPVSREMMPLDIDFSKGGMCGIANISGDIKNLQNKDGALSFTVAGKNAMFSWGNFDLTKPPLRICFDKHSHYNYTPIYAVKIKMRQSLPQSTWKVAFKQWAGNKIVTSRPVKAKGTKWRTLVIRSPHFLAPLTGFRIETETPGNKVEIAKIELCERKVNPCFRKTINLPAPVRWAKCSISAHGYYKLYVNGKLAIDAPFTYITKENTIYNYEIDPKLFKKGKNVIAFTEPQRSRSFLLDGALLCTDGTYVRFDTDETWKGKQDSTDKNWMDVNYNDSGWPNTIVYPENRFFKQPVNTYTKFYFNPSWKGRIMVKPADGRRDPIYGSKENISLKISVPQKTGEKQILSYKLFNEMGDYYHAEDTLVQSGVFKLKKDGMDSSALLEISAGKLHCNAAYALELQLAVNGKEVEKRRYELAVCGPVKQPVVKNPKNWWDGMKLKLVKEIDPTQNFSRDEFVSCIGDKPRSIEKPSKVITTPLGKFRQTYEGGNSGGDTGEGCSFLSWKFKVKNPGRPHVAIADYPDDTNRCQELRLTGIPPYSVRYGARDGAREMGNDTVVIGIDNPLTHTMKQHHVLFFPSWNQCVVSVFSIGGGSGRWNPERAARIGKIRIYEVLNDVPKTKITDAPGPRKWLFQQAEPGPRVIMMDCLSSPISSIMYLYLILSEAPNFYRNWMVTYMNLIKRMNFAGENAYSSGIFMYDKVLYPSKYSFATAFAYNGNTGSLKDSGVLMAKMFEENNLGMFVGMEIYGLPANPIKVTDADVANGADTLAQVDRNGRQLMTYRVKYASRIKSVVPNWLRPEVRAQFKTMVDELLDLYGNQKAFKGIVLYVIPSEGWGLGYKAKGGDPYFASYDDYTIGLFEKETGIKIKAPKSGPQRFVKRYEWLTKNARQQWIDWRAKKTTEMYQWLRDRLKQARPDLKLVIHFGEMDGGLDITEAGKSGLLYEHVKKQSLDLKALKDDKDIVLAKGFMCNRAAGRVLKGLSQGRFRAFAHSPAKTTAFANDGINGVAARFPWSEAQVFAPKKGWAWNYSATECWLFPGGDYFSDYLTNLFVRTNPTMVAIAIQDILVWNGREVELARFAQSFRSVPAAKYVRLTGNGLDKNIWLQVGEYGNDIYGYVANAQWWNLDAEIKFADDVELYDLLEEKTVKGGTWKLTLSPYRIRTFRIANAKGKKLELFKSAKTKINNRKDLDILKKQISDFAGQVKEYQEILKSSGDLDKAEKLLRECNNAVKSGNYDLAYEKLSLSTLPQAMEQFSWKENDYKPELFRIRELARPLKLDGSVAEWGGLSSTRISGGKKVVFSLHDVRWQGGEDLSGILYGAWDKNNLYLALKVKDDKYLPFQGTRTEKGDSIEIYLDMDIAGDYGSGEYSGDDFHLKISPSIKGSAPTVILRQGNNGSKKSIPDKGLKVVTSTVPGGYHLELVVPWKLLTSKPVKRGDKIGFDIGLFDRDRKAEGTEKVMLWSAPRSECWKDPRILGRIELIGNDNTGRKGSIKSKAVKLFKAGKYSEAMKFLKTEAEKRKYRIDQRTYIFLIKMAKKLSKEEKAKFSVAIRSAAQDKDLPEEWRLYLNCHSLGFVKPEEREGEFLKIAGNPAANPWIKGTAYFQLSRVELKKRPPNLKKALAYNIDAVLANKLYSSIYLYYLARICSQMGNDKAALGFAVLSWWGFFNSGNKPWMSRTASYVSGCLGKMGEKDILKKWKTWGAKGNFQLPSPIKKDTVAFPEVWRKKLEASLREIPKTDATGLVNYGEMLYRLGMLEQARKVFSQCLNLKTSSTTQSRIKKSIDQCGKWRNTVFPE